MSSITQSHDRLRREFATTRWSMVMQARAADPRDARSALVDLCLRYWYPVYAYVRRCGHAPDVAQDIARRFLLHLLAHFSEAAAPLARRQFRRYLLEKLNAFLASDWRATTESDAVPEFADPPPDLERRNCDDNADAISPEQAYQRSFALEILARAFQRLREEANQTGHLAMYEALEPYLAIDPAPGEYEEIAAGIGSRPLALVVALKRLRQRFRELTGDELADTVSSAEELTQEQQALHAILRERS